MPVPQQSVTRPAASTPGLTALTAAVPVSGGTTYLVTTELLPPGHPLLSGAVRALPAGLILIAITRRLPHGTWAWRSLLLGALNPDFHSGLSSWRGVRRGVPAGGQPRAGR